MGHIRMAPGSAARLAALLLALGPARPAAQVPKFDAEGLWLDPAARGSLVQGTGEVGPAGAFRISLAAGEQREPLVLRVDGLPIGHGVGAGGSVGSFVRDRLTLHLGASWVPVSRLELHARLPWVAWQRGDDLSAFGYGRVSSSGIASPSAGLRLALRVPGAGGGVGLAAALDAAPQVGNQAALASSRGFLAVPRLELGFRSAGWLLAAEVGARLRTVPVDFGLRSFRNELLAGAVLATAGAPLRAELAVRGAANLDRYGSSLDVLAGVRWAIGPVEIFAVGGPGFGEAPGTPRYRVLAGLALARSEEAARPAAPAPRQPARPAAPPPPAPRQAAPPPAPPPAPGPPPSPPEPAVPAPAPQPARPPLPPRAAPRPPRAAVGARRIELREKVRFERGSARVDPASRPLLDEVATLLAWHPEIERVVIEGHTDNSGNAARNRSLSRARAEAVRRYLVGKGVAPWRLGVRGYGPDRPVASNRTEAGREANRRVEFTIVRRGR